MAATTSRRAVPLRQPQDIGSRGRRPRGRFVTILLPGTGRVLNLAEVTVYGSALDPPSPPAAPAPLAPPPT